MNIGEDNLQKTAQHEEQSLKDILLLLWHARLIVISITLCFTIGSVIYALSAQKVYTSISKLIALTSGDASNAQLQGMAALAGIKLNGSNSKDPSAYLPEMLMDGDVLQLIIDKKWHVGNDSIKLEQLWHLNSNANNGNEKYIINKSKLDKLRDGGYIVLKQDFKTGLLTLQTSFSKPELAFQINQYVLILLDEYIQKRRRSQAKENLLFIEKRTAEVMKELEKSENVLAEFNNRNTVITAPRIILEQNRLTRTVMLNQEIYIQLKKQLEIASIEEKKEQPVIEIIRKPEIPISFTEPKRKLIVIVGTFFGLFVGVLFVFIKDILNSMRHTTV